MIWTCLRAKIVDYICGDILSRVRRRSRPMVSTKNTPSPVDLYVANLVTVLQRLSLEPEPCALQSLPSAGQLSWIDSAASSDLQV